MEGLIQIAKELFLATSIAGLFTVSPTAIIGAMLIMVRIKLTIITRDIRPGMNEISLAVTVVISLVSNMAFRFLDGLAVHYLTHPKQWNGDASGIK